MKPSARAASVFILLFIFFFNGLLVYLIIERISETKRKFIVAGTGALGSTLFEYQKLKAVDSASLPGYARIAYSPTKIEVNRPDTQSVTFKAPLSSLVTDTVGPGFIETIVNIPTFRSIDLPLFDSLFRKALYVNKVRSEYRLDTITARSRRPERKRIEMMWSKKKRKEFYYSVNPMRLPYNSNIFIFAELKKDPAFVKNDLLWPLVAFAFILLISNTALVFVYRTIRKQKRINELKTDFINNITHEMNTPITIALSGMEALEHHVPLTERTNFYLRTSKKQLHMLNDFTERILDAAVQDVSAFTLKKEKIDLHDLFGELVNSYSVLQGKPVHFKLTGEGPVYINGDRLYLETAFHNIIDNAIKYSAGSADISIDIAETGRDCIIKISDNGQGIPQQFIKNIFEKFFRVPQGDAQPVKGFGLGLYYVSSIVKKHSGKISVHSKEQSGTEFIITLPKHP